MVARYLAAVLIACSTAPSLAQSEPRGGGESPTFESKIVDALNLGGSPDAVEARLNRVAAQTSLSTDQRIAFEALRMLVRNKKSARGLRLADAEAFAARNPGSPATSMLIGEAALADDQPQLSADALTAAARGGGKLVDFISPTTVSTVIDKLDALADKDRTLALAKALVDGGWARGSANLRSFLAMEVIRASLSSGQIDEARRALPAVAQPGTMHAILIDNRLAALRPDVEAMAGAKLERHWRSYLIGARDDWLGEGGYLAAAAYAAALKQAGYHQTLVDTFLPRFMRGYNCPTDQVSRSLAQDIAESLAILGRWSKADDIMSRAGGVSIGAYAGILLEKGNFGQAASYFDRALKTAKPPADKQDAKARAWLMAARDCAAYRARQTRQAPQPDPSLLDVPAKMRFFLCLDRPMEARDMLIAALDDEDQRGAALKWLQPYNEPPTVSAFHKEMGVKVRALQNDPAVMQAAYRYGVILDWPLQSSAPPEAEFHGLPVRRATPCNAGWTDDLMPDSLRKPEDLYEKNPM